MRRSQASIRRARRQWAAAIGASVGFLVLGAPLALAIGHALFTLGR
jgi:hypothetical protein